MIAPLELSRNAKMVSGRHRRGDDAQEADDRGRQDRNGGHAATGHPNQLWRRFAARGEHEQHARRRVHARVQTAAAPRSAPPRS